MKNKVVLWLLLCLLLIQVSSSNQEKVNTTPTAEENSAGKQVSKRKRKNIVVSENLNPDEYKETYTELSFAERPIRTWFIQLMVKLLLEEHLKTGIIAVTAIILEYLIPPPFAVSCIHVPNMGMLQKIIHLLPSHDNRLLFVNDNTDTIKVWDLYHNEWIRTLRTEYRADPERPLRLSSDGNLLLSASKLNGITRVFQPTWDPFKARYTVESFADSREWKKWINYDPPAYCTLSSDSQHVLAHFMIDRISTWLLHSDDEANYREFSFVSGEYCDLLAGTRVLGLELTRNHQRLLAITTDPYEVIVWNFLTGEYLHHTEMCGGFIKLIPHPYVFTADERYLLFGFRSGLLTTCLHIFNTDDNQMRGVVLGSLFKVTSFAHHQDLQSYNHILAASGIKQNEVQIHVWVCSTDFLDNKLVKTIRPGGMRITAICFTTDGKRIVSAGDGREQIKIWDTTTGKLCTTKQLN